VSLSGPDIERLYRSHGPIVLRRARALLGGDADAQEALQEVFAALLRDPDGPREAGSLVAWLYQATTHHCLNQLRNRRTEVRLLEERVAHSQVFTAAPAGETLAEVRRLLAQLEPEVAAAVVYHHLDGLTHQEIAGQLGCSRRQVGYLLERARVSLERTEKSA
jgi:RNA polymerase sigma-70 factor (ECF subfamily)